MKTFYINNRKNNHVNEYTDSDGVKWSDLISYGVRVAFYNHEERYISVLGWHSATTAKHINEFLEYFGFDKMTKKQMKEKPTIDKK